MCNRFLLKAVFAIGILSAATTGEAGAAKNEATFGVSKHFSLENLSANATDSFCIFRILQANNEKCSVAFFSWKPRTSISDC